ncbi:Gfo/Idh/MocA family oxidoreductase [Kribbella sp. NPDC000426]|uniref:Gfo/Idh/MocA family protein n=1 Tax=Kribbella sp. NPDC000426 TaxID=3154255 RepID=UPI00332322F7
MITRHPAGPGRPVRMAVVGLHFGRTMLRTLGDSPMIDMVGVCDLDQDLTASVAADEGVRHYADLDEILADPEVDAVGLFTSPVGRAALLSRIVRSGKPVVTTKPFDIDPDQARAVLDEAGRRGVVIRLNSPSPSPSADLSLIGRWRTGHHLGRPIGAHAAVWASYQERPDGSWYDDQWRCPAAPITRLGVYLVNDLIRLMGPAERVQVLSSRVRTGRPTADNAQLALTFPGGALATVFASFCVDDGLAYGNELTVHFERGTITRARADRPGMIDLLLIKDGRPVESCSVPEIPDEGYDLAEFVSAVQSGAVITADEARQIVAGVAVLEAAGRAERSGAVEAVRASESEQ